MEGSFERDVVGFYFLRKSLDQNLGGKWDPKGSPDPSLIKYVPYEATQMMQIICI